MLYFKAEMHQIRFWLGLCPDPTRGAYNVPLDPLTGFKEVVAVITFHQVSNCLSTCMMGRQSLIGQYQIILLGDRGI